MSLTHSEVASTQPPVPARQVQIDPNRQTFSCAECGRHYVSPKNLTLHHNRVHRKLRPFTCSHCPPDQQKTFFSKKELTLHERRHRSERQQMHQWSLCSKSFEQEAQLEKLNCSQVHPNENVNDANPGTLPCRHCETVFHLRCCLKKHGNEMHEGQQSPPPPSPAPEPPAQPASANQQTLLQAAAATAPSSFGSAAPESLALPPPLPLQTTGIIVASPQ